MIIPINDNYQLSADQYCWAIQELLLRKRNGEYIQEWKPIRWHRTIEQAVNGLAELMMMTSDAETLVDALAEVKNVSATLGHALQSHFEVAPKGFQEKA